MSLNSQKLSNHEILTLVELLQKCEPGNLPKEVFEAVAKVAVYPAVEFVLLRRQGDTIETLLIKRPHDDIVWPSMYHLPGTVLRPTDHTFEDAFTRLYADELGSVSLSEPHFVGAHFNRYIRGNSIGIEYWLEVEGESSVGQFFDVKMLPETFIIDQTGILKRAVAAYTAKSD